MKIPLLYLLLLLSSCSAPIAYLNTVPRSSGLEKKGDVNANADLGLNPKTIQTGMSWSPFQRIGVSGDYFLNISKHDKLSYAEGRFTYYIPFKNTSRLEFNIGLGKGRITDDRSGRQFLTDVSYDYQVRSIYLTKSIQANYTLSDMDDGWRFTIGLRGRNIVFDEYSYTKYIDDEETNSYSDNSRWNVFILDPFIEMNQEFDDFSIYYRFNVSRAIYGHTLNPKHHPNYNPTGISIGTIFKLNSK